MYTHAYIYIYHVRTHTHIHIYTHTNTKCKYERTQSTSEMKARQRLRGQPNLTPRISALLPVRITTACRPDHIRLSALVQSRSTQFIVHASSQLGHAGPWPPETRSFFCHFGGVFGRRAWVLRRVVLHTNNARSTWMFFSFFITCKRTNNAKNATYYVKLGEKRRESFKRNYYIISPRVIIKAIIIELATFTVLWERISRTT